MIGIVMIKCAVTGGIKICGRSGGRSGVSGARWSCRHKNFKSALELMRRATYTPDKINRKEVWPRTKSSLTMHQSLVK